MEKENLERNTRTPLSAFIELLMNSEELPHSAEKALSMIAPALQLMRVQSHTCIPPKDKDGKQEFADHIWYDSIGNHDPSSMAGLDTVDAVHLTHQMEGDRATVTLSSYHSVHDPAWTSAQRQDILDFMNVLMLAFSKSRLISTLRRNALIEPMSQLPNAAGFISQAGKLLNRGQLSLYNAFYFNLKSFGLINRRFGKDETDRIIVRYSKALTDFTEGEECVGRLGGDNFVALIRKEKSSDFLRFISGVQTFGVIAGEEIPILIQAVAGALEIDSSITTADEIIGKCGTALHVAKNVEKVPYVFVTPELNSSVYQQKQIVEQFPAALINKEFKVFYQPKVDTRTNEIVGAEALIRWLSDGKIIPPNEFVPIIEKDGSICQLDFYVLENVCQDIRDWIAKGIKPVRVSTNFSRKNLSHPDFADRILELLTKYNIPREYIEVEITETTEEAENALLVDFMNCMHDEKIATAIDDFGTGYTSLNVLSDFSVDVLKIDKSFIERHTKTEKDSVVLSNVVKMAKELDMTIINEGVENWEQVDFLQNLGSTVVQGFLFDKPLPEESFRQRLKIGKYDISSNE